MKIKKRTLLLLAIPIVFALILSYVGLKYARKDYSITVPLGTNDYLYLRRIFLNGRARMECYDLHDTKKTFLTPTVCSSLWYVWEGHLQKHVSLATHQKSHSGFLDADYTPFVVPDRLINVCPGIQICFYMQDSMCDQQYILISYVGRLTNKNILITGSIARAMIDSGTNVITLSMLTSTTNVIAPLHVTPQMSDGVSGAD